jgi:hypothetical protein
MLTIVGTLTFFFLAFGGSGFFFLTGFFLLGGGTNVYHQWNIDGRLIGNRYAKNHRSLQLRSVRCHNSARPLIRAGRLGSEQVLGACKWFAHLQRSKCDHEVIGLRASEGVLNYLSGPSNENIHNIFSLWVNG